MSSFVILGIFLDTFEVINYSTGQLNLDTCMVKFAIFFYVSRCDLRVYCMHMQEYSYKCLVTSALGDFTD